MGEWRETTLGQFVMLQRGHDLPEPQRTPGDIPVLGSFGITGWHNEARANGPGVTIGRSGASFGVVSYSPVNYWPLNTALYVKDFCGNDEKFAFYFLSCIDFAGFNSGSAQPSLNRNFVNPLPIQIPPLAEQKAIAAVLSSLDDKIDLLHRQNKTLEALAETLFRQWFVEEAQEDWAEGCLGDVADLNPTYSLKKGTIAPYLEMKNLGTSTFAPDDWYDREFTSGMKFRNGDTLLARITPCLENGKTGYVAFLDENETGWGSTEFIVIRMKAPFHPFTSYVLARNNDFRDFVISNMTGSSGRQRAQADVVATYDLLIPPPDVIERLNTQLESIVTKLVTNANQIRTLEKLRDTLLPKLMSGEVRVAL